MPHNLYLHSAIAQTRQFDRAERGKRDAIRSATIDSPTALMAALLINAAILIVAAYFRRAGYTESPSFRMPTGCLLTPCWAAVLPACCLESHCWRRDRCRRLRGWP